MLVSPPQLCKSKFIISLSVSDRLSGRRSGSLKCSRASHRCAPLPPSRSAKRIYCHCQNFCQPSKGTRRQRQRAREQCGIFSPLPQMPGHAGSPTQRPFEISSLVNSCLMEARGGNAPQSLNGDTKVLRISFSPHCSMKLLPAAFPWQSCCVQIQVQSG